MTLSDCLEHLLEMDNNSNNSQQRNLNNQQVKKPPATISINFW